MRTSPTLQKTLAAVAILLAVAVSGCSSDVETGADQGPDSLTASPSEHDRDGDDHHGGEGEEGEEGEESGAELALDESYDQVRNGARLVLTYDAQSNSFQGTVENTTDETLKQVRVEVHLSNGKELGPTTPGDLEPGQKRDITLAATSTDFDAWTAHPEVGSGEHGHGEGGGEHGEEGEEGRGEHDRDGGEHGGEGGEHR